MTAQPVLPGDPDRERLWKIVTKYNKAYDEYQKKTRRADSCRQADAEDLIEDH